MPLGQWSISVTLILLNQFNIHIFMLSKSLITNWCTRELL